MKPFNPSFAADVESSFARQPIMSLIGARLARVEPGVVEIELPFRADLTQQDGYLHGGVITTVADSAAGYAAHTLMPAGSRVLSVEFKVNLLRPACGELFIARAEVIKPGRTLSVVRADVFANAANSEKKISGHDARHDDVFGVSHSKSGAFRQCGSAVRCAVRRCRPITSFS